MESSDAIEAKLQSMNGIAIRNIIKMPPIQKATLPQDFVDKDLTPKQINAFSKESLLKPVIQPPNRLVPVPPP
jgi:hypothetical protein